MKEPVKARQGGAEHSKSGAGAMASLRVVLVRTQHPGNIGAAARAMKTMGAAELVLVAPERPPDAQSEAMAAGAVDLIAGLRTCATLEEAVQDCARVAGVSARRRGISATEHAARGWAEDWAGQAGDTTTALVFGPERTGLTNDELKLCQDVVQIPANPDYASLNLAQAVQVLCYECRVAALAQAPLTRSRHRPADHAVMEGFYEHLEGTLQEIGFLHPKRPRHLMRRLRRLFDRARPDATEVNILRGILTAVLGRDRP